MTIKQLLLLCLFSTNLIANEGAVDVIKEEVVEWCARHSSLTKDEWRSLANHANLRSQFASKVEFSKSSPEAKLESEILNEQLAVRWVYMANVHTNQTNRKLTFAFIEMEDFYSKSILAIRQRTDLTQEEKHILSREIVTCYSTEFLKCIQVKMEEEELKVSNGESINE